MNSRSSLLFQILFTKCTQSYLIRSICFSSVRMLEDVEVRLFEKPEEWALDAWSGVNLRSLVEFTFRPELEPVEVVGSCLDIVLHPVVLKVEFVVAPERGDLVGTRHEPPHEVLFTAKLGSLVEAEDLKHDCVHGDNSQLVPKVVLILVCPSVDIVRLNINLVGPVRVRLLVSVLVEASQLQY